MPALAHDRINPPLYILAGPGVLVHVSFWVLGVPSPHIPRAGRPAFVPRDPCICPLCRRPAHVIVALAPLKRGLVRKAWLNGADSDGPRGGILSLALAGSGGAMLVERLMRRVFDRNGRCWQRVAFCKVLTPAQYDARCAAVEAAGRPATLQRALGDLRTGAELVADVHIDRRLSLGRLVASRRGRECLRTLAAEVERRFGPRVSAARDVVDGCSHARRWARELEERPWPPRPPSPEDVESGKTSCGGGEICGLGSGDDEDAASACGRHGWEAQENSAAGGGDYQRDGGGPGGGGCGGGGCRDGDFGSADGGSGTRGAWDGADWRSDAAADSEDAGWAVEVRADRCGGEGSWRLERGADSDGGSECESRRPRLPPGEIEEA